MKKQTNKNNKCNYKVGTKEEAKYRGWCTFCQNKCK